MKLLLDVHHSPAAAARLQEFGHDVIAAAKEPALANLGDDEVLRAATTLGRAIVTENARDFDRIVRQWSATGQHHAGVVFTSPRRFHRGSAAYPANLIAGLVALIQNPPGSTVDWFHWI